MGFLDRLLGRQPQLPPPTPVAPHGAAAPASSASTDEQAIQRYEYLLRTAPPEQLEQAHAQAFAQLTPAQRDQMLRKLSQAAPHEAPQDDSPAALARSATRLEMQQPGALQRTFGGPGLGGRAGGAGMAMGGMLLSSIAGAFIGTAIAQQLFDQDEGSDQVGEDSTGDADTQGDDPQAGDPQAGDPQAGDAAYGDTASDSGDVGGGFFDGGGFDGGDFGGDF